jgi:hypothetical protein
MNEVELYRAYTPAPLYADLGQGLIKVYFNEQSKEVTVPSMDEETEPQQATEYTAWHVDVTPDYSHIISSIVRSKYSQDDVEAILCNHVEGRIEDEYDDLVAWRSMARNVASQVMKALGKVV